MYSDRKRSRLPLLIAAGVVVLLLALGLLFFRPGPELKAEGAAAIEAAVRRSALQCYVVEGVYPPNLAYLEENYGLQINTDDYYVNYSAFSSNLPPTVRVIAR